MDLVQRDLRDQLAVRRQDFDELKAEIRVLAEAQQRTEEVLRQLLEFQARTEKTLARLETRQDALVGDQLFA